MKHTNPLERFFQYKAKFFDYLLNTTDIKTTPWWQQFVLKVVRTITAVLRDLSDGQLNMRAMSLVYTTLLSFVPLLAISFSVLKGFGVHNQIEPFLLNIMEPLGEERFELVPRIIGFVDNIEVGVLGIVGIAVLFYTVIALMTKIERSFNYTWNVTEARGFAARFADYLTVLFIGPVLIFISVGLTTALRESDMIVNLTLLEFTGPIIQGLFIVIPYLLLTGAFAFVYIFIPNTKVEVVPALVGGAVTAILWKLLGVAFALIVDGSSNYSAIYSAFATLIFFMIWLYAGWLVLLVGACISCYVQNPSNVLISRERLFMSNEMRERLGLSIIGRVAVNYYSDTPQPITVENLAGSLKLPIRVVERTVLMLRDQGILVQNGEKPFGLLPAKPFDNLTVSDLLIAIRSAETERGFITSRANTELKVLETMSKIEESYRVNFDDTTIREWALDTSAGARTLEKPRVRKTKKTKSKKQK